MFIVRENEIFSCSGTKIKRGVEFRNLIRNASRIRWKVSRSVLMGTECLHTRFPGPYAYPAVCGTQKEAKNKIIKICNNNVTCKSYVT